MEHPSLYVIGSRPYSLKRFHSSTPSVSGIYSSLKVRVVLFGVCHRFLTCSLGVPFLFRVGLAIVLRCKAQVMQSSERDNILNLLLHPPSGILPDTADAFLELTTAVKLKDGDVLKQRAKLFDAQMKRQAQSRTLPSQTSSMSSTTAPSISLPRR